MKANHENTDIPWNNGKNLQPVLQRHPVTEAVPAPITKVVFFSGMVAAMEFIAMTAQLPESTITRDQVYATWKKLVMNGMTEALADFADAAATKQ